MLLLVASVALATPALSKFPERTPGLIASCLADAVRSDQVSVTDDSHKYICAGEVAQRLWAFLEKAEVDTYEEDVGEEGVWLGREFPLGACFKRIRRADGSATGTGLSCTIWIPRPVS